MAELYGIEWSTSSSQFIPFKNWEYNPKITKTAALSIHRVMQYTIYYMQQYMYCDNMNNWIYLPISRLRRRLKTQIYRNQSQKSRPPSADELRSPRNFYSVEPSGENNFGLAASDQLHIAMVIL